MRYFLFIIFQCNILLVMGGIGYPSFTKVIPAHLLSKELIQYKNQTILGRFSGGEENYKKEKSYFTSDNINYRNLIGEDILKGFRVITYENSKVKSVIELNEKYQVVFTAVIKSEKVFKITTTQLFGEAKTFLFGGSEKKELAAKSAPEAWVKEFYFVTNYDAVHNVPRKLWMVSIGINNYGKYKFNSCVSDAESYTKFFTESYKAYGNLTEVKSFTLVERNATKDSIESSLKFIASNARPNDYFVFCFNGMSTHPEIQKNTDQIYFVPWGIDFKDSSYVDETLKSGNGMISLQSLKNYFEFIPIKNQLIITEAGPTENFKADFVKALMSQKTEIVSMLDKNRVIITPNGLGLDDIRCKDSSQKKGPLNYFITSQSNPNIFELFDKNNSTVVAYALKAKEMSCDLPKNNYFSIFFEKEFLEMLKLVTPESSEMRGVGKNYEEKIDNSSQGDKYAIFIGTNKYDYKPWKKLENPVYDITEISSELQQNYGYKTVLLVDTPINSVYKTIREYSKILKEKDQLIIYFAGHGDFEDQLFDDGMLVFKDSRSPEEDENRTTYLAYTKLSKMINKLPPKQILLMLDVCFGGSFNETGSKFRNKDEVYKDMSASRFFSEKSKLKTRLFITSGGKKEVPDGYAGRHSPFAYYLLS